MCGDDGIRIYRLCKPDHFLVVEIDRKRTARPGVHLGTIDPYIRTSALHQKGLGISRTKNT